MYSEEIKKYLKLKKYILTLDEYLKLIENPQVRRVIYNENNYFTVLTDDGYNFSFKIIENKS